MAGLGDGAPVVASAEAPRHPFPVTPQHLLAVHLPTSQPTLVTELPPGRWHLEHKLDGFRGVAAVVDGRAALWSRHRTDLSRDFPQVVRALGKLRGQLVLDGELVALDTDMIGCYGYFSDFSRSFRCGPGRPSRLR